MKKCCTLVFSLVPFFALAQANFKPAYVVTAAGDTLKGFIDYKEWDHSPAALKFSRQANGVNPQIFTAKSAKGFSVIGLETYASFTGRISADKNVSPDISTGIDTSTVDTSVFLKQLNNGPKVILYQHKDDLKTRFFISEKSKSPRELSYHIFINADNGVTETSIFKGQLKVLADTYAPTEETLQKKIDYIRYSGSDLLKIVDQINHTKTNPKTLPGKSFRFFAGAGVNDISTKFTGDNKLSLATDKTVYTPFVSGGVDFFVNPLVQKLLFRIEASYWYQRRSFYVNTASDFSLTTSERYELKQSSVTLTPQVMYALLNKENDKIYLGFGAGLNYSFYHNGPHVITYIISGDQTVEPYQFEKFWFNCPVEISGMFNKHVDVSFKYYITGSFSNYSYFNVKSDIMSLGVHYLF